MPVNDQLIEIAAGVGGGPALPGCSTLHCPRCGRFLRSLKTPTESWGGPFLEVDCFCGVRTITKHIEDNPRLGMEVKVICLSR